MYHDSSYPTIAEVPW